MRSEIFIEKGKIVKLFDGRLVKIINTPNTFLSGGAYEVIEWVDNGIGEIGKKFWIKPDDIFYGLNKDLEDDLSNYFEFIFDEYGLNVIPKNVTLIEIDEKNEKMKTLNFITPNRKHEKIIFHLGDTEIKKIEE